MKSSENVLGSTTETQIITIDKFFEENGANQVQSIVNAELQDSDTQTYIVDIAKLLASVYENLKNGLSEGELEKYTNMVSNISNKYKDNPKLSQAISNWRKARRELIEISNSSAGKLDQYLFVVNTSRMVSLAIEILNSLNLGLYQQLCSNIASCAYNISPKLGLVMEGALELAPHLRFMGFASTFFEILRSQVIINCVVNAMKKDRDMFKPLKEWFDETDEFEESVKKLFPYEIDKEIVESIKGALDDLGKEETVFAATILSNIKKDPMIYKDGKFLAKVFLFCRSDAAMQWYTRMVTGACPADLECDLLYFRTELQQLEETDVDTVSKLEIGKFKVEQVENALQNNTKSFLIRLVLCGMNCMSIYYCYENIKAGSKHRYSDRLRELSTNAQSFFHKMEKIKF